MSVHKEKQPKMRVARQFLVSEALMPFLPACIPSLMYGFDKPVSFHKQ
jgi:hypothetical protein